jgi:hypothetical protein
MAVYELANAVKQQLLASDTRLDAAPDGKQP